MKIAEEYHFHRIYLEYDTMWAFSCKSQLYNIYEKYDGRLTLKQLGIDETNEFWKSINPNWEPHVAARTK